jgi:hypothetical protein
MKNTENRIDQLFESTRTEAPIRSFESSKEVFIVGLESAAPIGILAKWAKISFTFKTLIMLGIIGTVTTLTICLVGSGSSHEKIKPLELFPQTETTEVIDRVNEVVVKTTYFDTEKQLVEIRVEPTKIDASDSSWMEIIKDFDTPLPPPDFEGFIVVPPTFLEDDDSVNVDQKTTTRSFIIEKNTSDLEMEKIRKLAEAAGLEFNYRVLVWKGRIKRCTIHVYMNNGKGGYCKYDSQLSGKFHKQIEWVEDENGKAISFKM